MNKALMKQNIKDYQPFIDLMFEGLLNKSLTNSEDDILYRGTQMTRNEIDNIMKVFEQWKQKGDDTLPSFLLYSRCFLSFSKDENVILNFIGKTDEKFYGIVFILKNNNKIIQKFSSNTDIEYFSSFNKEREVLFYPYSTFCLESIHKGEFKGINCVIINLEYLGKYSHIFETIKKDENFKNNFIETFNNQNYSKEIIKSKIIAPIQSDINIQKKNVFEKTKNMIYEKFDIKIKEECDEEKKPIENMIVINVGEKNIIIEKKPEDSKEIEIDSDLLNSIHEKNIKKDKIEKK